MSFYDEHHRALQDHFDSRALADTLQAITVQPELDDDTADFLAGREFFFLTTVRADGFPTVSHKGGPAGFAKGTAKVSLADDGGATILSYEVNVEVGGKLAQVGGRLIEGTSKKLAGEFFDTFSSLVGSTKVAAEEPAAALADPPLLWAQAAIVAAIFVSGFAL